MVMRPRMKIFTITVAIFLIVSCGQSSSSSSSDTSSDISSTTSVSETLSSTSQETPSSSSSSYSESSSSSESSSLPNDEIRIAPIIDTFNLDDELDLIFSINSGMYSFSHVEGLGITATDYEFLGGNLSIKSHYLRYFLSDGIYELDAVFTNIEGQVTEKLIFEIVRDNHSNRIHNAGFETGDYHGWNAYQLWKDESGLSSFRSERIVNNPNYGSLNANTYNRDGNYHLGVYASPYSGTNKDINQERMGMLRSSDFVLGGSGWISFKLGGGQNIGTAYLSVKESVTNIEIARFGNRHFGNTAISGTANAEAYLFQYYADLSAHIGKTLYVLVTDAASHEWNVLSLDSVETFLETAPTPTPEEVAIDIKPVIYGIGQNNTSIINTLSSNVNNWEDPSNIFQFTDNRARTNKTLGDAALGVVRSPAFKVSSLGNRALVWEWEGALNLDKQIFLLVKEVHTNIEVLRLTRRDNLSSKSGGGMDKHWYDLGWLAPDKEYYVELVDNAKSSWGLISIRNIDIVPINDSRASLATDMAINCNYGLARVDFATGGYRQASDYSYEQVTSVLDVFVSLGEDASTSAILGYQTNSNHTWIEYRKQWQMSVSIEPSAYNDTQGVKRVEFNELHQNATYQYRIHDRANASSWKRFLTPDPNDFTFAFAGDSQSLSLESAHILENLFSAALYHDEGISFGLMTGDLVEEGANEKMWQWFFEATRTRETMAIMGVPGNHDYYATDGVWFNNNLFEQKIPHPRNGIGSFSSYYFKIGNALFIMLDAVDSTYGQSQIDWFRGIVSDNPATHIIVGTHYSAYGGHHATTSENFRNVWSPVFDECNVDVVLSGHDHLFTRTPPMRNNIVNRSNGTIYLTGGSASAKIYDVPASLYSQYDFYMSARQNVITIVNVTNTAINFTTINPNGDIVDQFSTPV